MLNIVETAVTWQMLQWIVLGNKVKTELKWFYIMINFHKINGFHHSQFSSRLFLFDQTFGTPCIIRNEYLDYDGLVVLFL